MQVWARLIVRKVLALLGTGHMDCTTFVEFTIKEKNAGAVRLNLKSVSVFDIFFPNLPVTDAEMTPNTVNIRCGDKESRTRKTITAETWTIVAKHPVAGVFFLSIHVTILHALCFSHIRQCVVCGSTCNIFVRRLYFDNALIFGLQMGMPFFLQHPDKKDKSEGYGHIKKRCSYKCLIGAVVS